MNSSRNLNQDQPKTVTYYRNTIESLKREKQHWYNQAYNEGKANLHHIEWGKQYKKKFEDAEERLKDKDKQIKYLKSKLRKSHYHHSNKIRDFNNACTLVKTLKYANDDLKAKFEVLTDELRDAKERIKRLKHNVNTLSGFADVPADTFNDEDFDFNMDYSGDQESNDVSNDKTHMDHLSGSGNQDSNDNSENSDNSDNSDNFECKEASGDESEDVSVNDARSAGVRCDTVPVEDLDSMATQDRLFGSVEE